MRETEDIDDYFRIFVMTAKTQQIPRSDWLGSLAPRLSEKAKSIFLEISGWMPVTMIKVRKSY